MADYRINIGNGEVIIAVYGSLGAAEEMMHDIIAAVEGGAICVEEKAEVWTRVPT
jgi:hypothetical protein